MKKTQRLYINSSGNDYLEVRTGSLSKEIATRDKTGFDYASLLGHMPNPDAVLRGLGREVTAYDELKSDGHLSGVIGRRKAGTMKKLWMLDRENIDNDMWCDAAEDMIKTLNVQQRKSEILDSRGYGHQPIEITTDRVNDLEWPVKFEAKPVGWFRYDSKGNLILRDKYGLSGEIMPAGKFIIPKNDPRYDNPYGDALLSKCFWYVTFKRGGLEFWMKFTEKYGMPWAIAKYPEGMLKPDIETLIEIINNAVQDALLVVSAGTQADIVQTGSTASAEIFKGALDYCGQEISKIWLGHGAAMDSTTGQLGNENAALYAAADLIESDDQLVSEVFNELIDRFYTWNFSATAPRPKFLLYAKKEVDIERANRDAILVTCGIEFLPAYIEEGYGLKEGVHFKMTEKPALPTLPTTQPGAIPSDDVPTDEAMDTDGQSTKIDDAMEEIVEDKPESQFAEIKEKSGATSRERIEQIQSEMITVDAFKKISDKLRAPILDAVRNVDNLEQAQERIRKAYPAFDTDEFAQQLTKSMFLSALVGAMGNEPDDIEVKPAKNGTVKVS